MFVFCFFASIATELRWPQFANWAAYVLGSIILMILAGCAGALIDVAKKSHQNAKAPLNFIDYLWRYALPAVRDVIKDDLTWKADQCMQACTDSIKFQQEELSGTGRASPGIDVAIIEETRKKIEERVKMAKDDFYKAYDTVAPFAAKFGGLRERSFKAYVTTKEDRVA